jgi:hypothetical protein
MTTTNCFICAQCRAPLSGADAREAAGKILCEDCYLDALSVNRTCDPWALHLATSDKLRTGVRLSDLQQKLFGLVQERQEISFPDAARALSLKEEELRQEFAVLRHMELLRACRKDDLILITLF